SLTSHACSSVGNDRAPGGTSAMTSPPRRSRSRAVAAERRTSTRKVSAARTGSNSPAIQGNSRASRRRANKGSPSRRTATSKELEEVIFGAGLQSGQVLGGAREAGGVAGLAQALQRFGEGRGGRPQPGEDDLHELVVEGAVLREKRLCRLH